MKRNNRIFKYIVVLAFATSLSGCNKLLDVDLPASELPSPVIYQSDETALAAVNGIYKSIVGLTYYYHLHVVPGETSDELFKNSFVDDVYTANDIPVDDGGIMSVWSDLYTRKEAESYASLVIAKSSLYSLVTDLSADNSPFITNNSEAILQIPYFTVTYIYEGSALFDDTGSYLIRDTTLFETGDARATNWTTSISADDGHTYYAPLRYHNSYNTTPDERSTFLRLSEQYLIRAEARAEQNNLSGAVEDLTTIRNRALLSGSGATSDIEKTAILASVAKERQRELFAEFVHRWFDLKRTGKLDSVLSPIKSAWTSTDALYPIPQSAINTNPNLTQNSGYN